MRFGLIILNVVFLFPSPVSGQKELKDSVNITTDEKVYFNNVFIEIGGTSGFYNLGYERIYFSKNQVSLSSGIEWSYRKLHPSISDPHMVFGLNLLGFTYGKKHQVELELGMTWGIDMTPTPGTIAQQLERKRQRLPTEPTFTSSNSVGLGYRYNLKQRWLLRCKFLYIFKYDLEYREYWHQPWGDIGFGYKF
jgi:hypothetical protein